MSHDDDDDDDDDDVRVHDEETDCGADANAKPTTQPL